MENVDILNLLEGRQFLVDELGRIMIEDDETLQLIKGSEGLPSGLNGDIGWNAGCINAYCF